MLAIETQLQETEGTQPGLDGFPGQNIQPEDFPNQFASGRLTLDLATAVEFTTLL